MEQKAINQINFPVQSGRCQVQYFQVTGSAPEELKRGFIGLYKEAFSEPPYFEQYSDRQVEGMIWKNHLEEGCMVLALDADSVIGLGCCIPLAGLNLGGPCGSVKEFLQSRKSLPFDLDKTCYMSDIAVKREYRRQGIGLGLIKERFRWIKNQNLTHYVMRTAVEGSKSLSLYEKIGARKADFIQEVSDKEIVSASKQRIFLYGPVI